MLTDIWPLLAPALAITSAAMTAGLLALLYPHLLRIALVKPNARSSHSVPTPQGGGIAVMLATAVCAAAACVLLPLGDEALARLGVALGAALALAAVGAVDDVRSLSALPRLLVQFAAVAAVIATLPGDWRLVPALPWWLERTALLIAGVWFVNLVNFMDGLDWITVAEVVPVAAALACAGALGALPQEGSIVALALGGAMLGFAPFNRPRARLFLGDAGSLPIALLLCWLLLLLASRGHTAAALLLPLYYVADATLTLLMRLARRERVWEAHRTHFYQRATDRGFTPLQIVARVFGLNLVLGALALATVVWPGRPTDAAMLLLGCALVGALLHRFAKRAIAPDRAATRV
jgi:UDP-N-acetylmuramyl pentapeptide phosphotransferase/UDP-N-acetylglucosamine-1-phosphate transferase